MMQIRELVLYGRNGKVRHLPFSLGTVNIITGKSKSGKSAVGDIIDYCMGGSSCNIAATGESPIAQKPFSLRSRAHSAGVYALIDTA